VIVLAESNFVLEIALRQEQFEHAQRILRLAEERQLRLVVPACSLIEPYQTLIRRRSERKEFSRRLQAEIKLLQRSALRGVDEETTTCGLDHFPGRKRQHQVTSRCRFMERPVTGRESAPGLE
jgi:predicted nucleic acid-binding protein